MYHENDLVVYGTYGVCKIIEISSKALMGKPQDYYVLKPVEDERATVFVPVRNEALVTKNMRPVLSEDQASELIEALQQAPSMWVTDGHERRDRYQRIISSGNCSELSRLVKTLYQKKLQLLKEGKKLHTSDEQFLRSAEKMLTDELAIALHLDRKSIPELIQAQMAAETDDL